VRALTDCLLVVEAAARLADAEGAAAAVRAAEALRVSDARLAESEAARFADAERAAAAVRAADARLSDALIRAAEVQVCSALASSAAEAVRISDGNRAAEAAVRTADAERAAESAPTSDAHLSLADALANAREVMRDVEERRRCRRIAQAWQEQAATMAAERSAWAARIAYRHGESAASVARAAVVERGALADAARVVTDREAASRVLLAEPDAAHTAASGAQAAASGAGMTRSTRRGPRPPWNSLWYCKPH
jgi:hypothetical protein